MFRRMYAAMMLLLASSIAAAGVVDVPKNLREKNYAPEGAGSCAWASTITALRSHGLFPTADWVRTYFHSGASIIDIEKMLAKSNTRWAQTDGSYEQSYEECVEFLEWAMRNRHVCGIAYKPYHAINIVGLTDTHAILLDNNWPDKYEYVPRDVFLLEWYYSYGGYAWTFVHTPIPPWPDLATH